MTKQNPKQKKDAKGKPKPVKVGEIKVWKVA